MTPETYAGQGLASMTHEIAKLLLERADTFVQRTEAVRTALRLGMDLSDIMQYLDWLELMRGADVAPEFGDDPLEQAG